MQEQAAVDSRLERATSRAATSISRELTAQIELLGILAESPRLDAPFQADAFAEIADRLRARVSAWSSIRVSDVAGKLMLASPQTGAAAPPKLVDPKSHARVIETGQAAVGDMMLGPSGNLGFAVRVPVMRDGAVTYVLSALLRPALLAGTLQQTSLPAGWQSWIVDDHNLIIAADNPDLPTLAKNEVEANVPVSTSIPLGGAQRLTSAPVDGVPWRVYVALPAAEYARPQQVAGGVLAVTLLAALLLITMALELTRRELTARRQQDAAIADWQRLDALSKLAGGLAHDFNNLLMGVQAGVEQLQRKRHDDERFAKVSGMILDSVERGKSTTQRLLGFSRRSDSGSQTFRLQDRADDLLELAKQAVQEGTRVTFNFDPDLWPVRADPSALEIALVNIASNAREAMPQGGELRIVARNIERAEDIIPHFKGEYVLLSLTDTGPGIAPEVVNRVFDPFFTTKGPGASGLGLSQVYGFAVRSGGTALAASVPGAGTAISLMLPRAHADQLPLTVVATATLTNASVLVVDDTHSVAESLASTLENAGLRAEFAYSAAEALQKLAKSRFDLLLTDVTMPGMSGLDLSFEVKQRFPSMGILLMTGYSAQLESGAANPFPVLSKPFKERELLTALASVRQTVHTVSNVVRLGDSRTR